MCRHNAELLRLAKMPHHRRPVARGGKDQCLQHAENIARQIRQARQGERSIAPSIQGAVN